MNSNAVESYITGVDRAQLIFALGEARNRFIIFNCCCCFRQEKCERRLFVLDYLLLRFCFTEGESRGEYTRTYITPNSAAVVE